mmetsp:Transcript_18152/g.51268  ORF Transcript_18152/g.51268 Transcript_18152/m.51268 type:complete len:123 (-) Transcript_18152:86-454(-)
MQGMSRAVLRAFVLSDPLYRYGTPKAPHRSEATQRTLARLVDLLCEGDAAGELTLHDILAQHDEAPSGYDNVLQIARCEDDRREGRGGTMRARDGRRRVRLLRRRGEARARHRGLQRDGTAR